MKTRLFKTAISLLFAIAFVYSGDVCAQRGIGRAIRAFARPKVRIEYRHRVNPNPWNQNWSKAYAATISSRPSIYPPVPLCDSSGLKSFKHSYRQDALLIPEVYKPTKLPTLPEPTLPIRSAAEFPAEIPDLADSLPYTPSDSSLSSNP